LRSAPRAAAAAALLAALALAMAAPAIAAIDGAAAAHAPPAVASREAQLLSRHRTVARLSALQQQPCRFRTAQCPNECGHGGSVAVFEVVRYLEYHKEAGQQYGDPQQALHHVKLGAGAGSEAQALAGLGEAIRALPLGAPVRLDWDHIYVTTSWAGGGVGKGPERPVTRLEAFADEAAAAAATL